MTVPLTTASAKGLEFEALYRAARDDVYAYVATLLRDRAAAEDVTALAFERAFRKRGGYDVRGRRRARLAARRGAGRARDAARARARDHRPQVPRGAGQRRARQRA